MYDDLTISDIIDDPLIGLLLKADRIPKGAFAQLLQSAARIQAARTQDAAGRVSFASGGMVLPPPALAAQAAAASGARI